MNWLRLKEIISDQFANHEKPIPFLVILRVILNALVMKRLNFHIAFLENITLLYYSKAINTENSHEFSARFADDEKELNN